MKILAGFAPKNLLYLLPLIFPLYLVKFDLRGVPFNVLEAVILLLFGGQILIWLWNLALGLRSDAGFYMKHLWLRNRGFLGWSLVFLVISLIAVIIVPESQLQIDGVTVFESKKIALGILKGWIILPYLYFTMLWFNTREKKDLFTSLYAYIFSALPLVIWAYYQYITGDFITMDARASGPFVNANYLAMYLAPAVCALWVLIVRGIVLGFKLPKFLIGVFLAAVYSVALLMTQSYGAMLAVMFSLFLFFISALNLHKRFQKLEELDLLKKIAYFLGAFALIAGLSAVVLFAPTQKWKLFTEFQQRSSNSVRLQVYRISSQFLEESPWLGIGFGQFQPLYNLKAPEILSHAPYEWVMLHPHNTFLAVWLNLGVIGLTMFLGLLFYCFRKVLLNHSYEDKFFRLLGISMLLVMLFHGVFDTYLFKNDLAMLFWLVVALCVLPRNYVIKGKVVQGARMGQKLGFPTANLQLEQSNLPMEKLHFLLYL